MRLSAICCIRTLFQLSDPSRVAHPFASQKVDKLILEETEAGRRFLATLRRNHERELEAASDGPGTQELTAGEGVHRRQGATIVAARSLAKDKRSSLRATLEHLIVRYLRRLTSNDDADGDDGDEPGGYEVAARYRRQSLPAADSAEGVVGISAAPDTSASPGFSNSMEITLLTNDTDTNQTDSWEDSARAEGERWDEPPDSSLTAGTGEMEPRAPDAAEGYGSSGPLVAGLLVGTREGTGDVSVGEGGGTSDHGDGGGGGGDSGTGPTANGDSVFRDNGDEVEYNLPIGGSVPTVNDETDGQQMMGELRKQRKQQKPKQRGECGSVRKRVSQLDRFELERSMRNGSFREYNIRNALNYR
uniref:Uncharacterized protein n=1 Tax=Anopheles maculatus TaxID=74869 RepID=A0A182SCN1_9DIPT